MMTNNQTNLLLQVSYEDKIVWLKKRLKNFGICETSKVCYNCQHCTRYNIKTGYCWCHYSKDYEYFGECKINTECRSKDQQFTKRDEFLWFNHEE